jgi:hypothetical protein
MCRVVGRRLGHSTIRHDTADTARHDPVVPARHGRAACRAGTTQWPTILIRGFGALEICRIVMCISFLNTIKILKHYK